MVGTSAAQSPEEMSLLTSTVTVASNGYLLDDETQQHRIRVGALKFGVGSERRRVLDTDL
jgi:hypothetical protein